MICMNCKGTGKIESFMLGKEIDCPECKGKGFIGKTNFSRITATPEALAEFIGKMTCECWGCKIIYRTRCPHYKSGLTCFCDNEDVLEWLKKEIVDEVTK